MLALRYGADGADRGGFAWTDDGAALSVGLVTEPATLRISVEAVGDALLVSDVSIVTDDARSVDEYVLYPASHYVATAEEVERVAQAVLEELDDDLAAFRGANQSKDMLISEAEQALSEACGEVEIRTLYSYRAHGNDGTRS